MKKEHFILLRVSDPAAALDHKCLHQYIYRADPSVGKRQLREVGGTALLKALNHRSILVVAHMIAGFIVVWVRFLSHGTRSPASL